MLMKLLSLFFILVSFPFTYTLNPKKLPNGKPLKYVANKKSPSSDLKIISPAQASLITKNWMENIVVGIFNDENKKLQEKTFSSKSIFDYDDLHIVTNINQLEQYIQDSYSVSKEKRKTLFLAWNPQEIHGQNNIIFIIVVYILIEKQEFVIRHLVQSPFWDPSQIDSNQLKIALEDQNCKNNCTTINLDYLYENDLRYKLAWAVWNLTLDKGITNHEIE